MEGLMRVYGSHILINLATRRLSYLEGKQIASEYPVGVGKASTPTPTGNYSIVEKVMHPGGALGTRWMGLSIPGGNYGIHGTNNPPSIGGYVSNGCIRMFNHDVEVLFNKVNIGTPVEIVAGSSATSSGTPVTPSTGAGQAGTHIVKAGDSLWSISKRYGKSLDEIIRANKISNPDLIYPGMTIIIPR